MSKYLAERLQKLTAYVPGEQPKERKYIKLNTNESPYPPHEKTAEAVANESLSLRLYSDPESTLLTNKVAEKYGLEAENILLTNGSDEILSFAFAAYGEKGFVFPAPSYGFYKVFGELYGVEYTEIPVREDFSVAAEDYIAVGKNIVIANPNAPTGLTLTLDEIEDILKSNLNYVVVIDEAYVDFGAESAIGLVKKYGNLLVTRTFSKSFSLAGARLGFGAASKEIIDDLKKIKYSTNPYNVNRLTMAAGLTAIEEYDYYMENCRKVAATREACKRELKELGFYVTDSESNFLFVSHEKLDGEFLYLELKKRGILIRHFDSERIKNYNRITVGTPEDMQKLIDEIKKILTEI